VPPVRTSRREADSLAKENVHPEDAAWNAERRAVEFGVEIGEYRGVVRVPRQVFQPPRSALTPPRGVR
jgi:hypothetical protein